MEHIVQFAIGMDDNAIKQRVEDAAVKTIIDNIQQEVRDKLFTPCDYSRSRSKPGDPLSEYSKNLVNDFLSENKDELLDKAALYLADRLCRTKAAKDIISKNEGGHQCLKY